MDCARARKRATSQIAADAGYLLCRREGPQTGSRDRGLRFHAGAGGCRGLRARAGRKDDTDSMLALREGLRRGCAEFHLYGATGGRRLDHTLANLQALAFLCRHGARGYLYDRGFIYTVIENETLTLRREVEWGLVSLFAMSGRAEHVTLTGLQYPLVDGTLESDFPLGVSNHFVAPEASVTVGKGLLLVGWEDSSARSGRRRAVHDSLTGDVAARETTQTVKSDENKPESARDGRRFL